MNVRKHLKHIEIDVGEFSFQNALLYIFMLLYSYKKKRETEKQDVSTYRWDKKDRKR
jgi:hypothetical protein